MSDVNPQTLIYLNGSDAPMCVSESFEEVLFQLNDAFDVSSPLVPFKLFDGRPAVAAPSSIAAVFPCPEKYREEVLEEATNG